MIKSELQIQFKALKLSLMVDFNGRFVVTVYLEKYYFGNLNIKFNFIAIKFKNIKSPF